MELGEQLFDVMIVSIFELFVDGHVEDLFSEIFVIGGWSVSEGCQKGASVDFIFVRFGKCIFLEPPCHQGIATIKVSTHLLPTGNTQLLFI